MCAGWQRMEKKGYAVICVAEGAGQELLARVRHLLMWLFAACDVAFVMAVIRSKTEMGRGCHQQLLLVWHLL